ncbi:MAG: hypothetical protein EXQ99_01420 [Alphaproteobacteria bacterium]|nr:hypothetical protein [Alphaproteobacteria bacterium]
MRWKLWIVAGVAVVMGASATRAENWVQMDPNNPVYYDADSIFVDAATGYIVYNGATDPDGDGTFNYAAFAHD